MNRTIYAGHPSKAQNRVEKHEERAQKEDIQELFNKLKEY